MRRALPLTVLLKMGMAFPGQAPRRLAVARRAASVRDLHRRIEEARSKGVHDQPTVAAEKIVTLAASLSAHDRTTRGHAERVRALTDMIADELRLPPLHRDRLRWSALLHDIGKLTVHSHVLNKEGTLSDEEWVILRRHPLEGARLTAPIAGWLGEWANTIAEHHERFDGRGYPFGLSGRDISLGGRIVAVADSFDVMTSMRSYKRPVGPEKARLELAACAGSQFDPDVVRAFLAVSVWRLRMAAPFSWIASMTSARVVGSVARVGAVSGHSVIAGVAAGAGILGLTALAPFASGPVPKANGTPVQVAASVGGGSSATTTPGPGGGTSAGGAGATSGPGSTHPGKAASGVAGTGTTTTTTTKPGTTTTTKPGTTTTTKPGTTTTTSKPPGTTTTTTTAAGTTTTTTTTTTTAPAPPAPPSGLVAKGQCQILIIGPEVVLTWTDSPTPTVTSYTVLRETGSSGGFTSIAQVAAGTSSYTDTSANGLGATYTYEIQANAPSGTAHTDPVAASTPTLCL
jgi:putative nucleotidyltransferase with HDIG domain